MCPAPWPLQIIILALRMLRGALPLWLLLRDEITEALPLCGCLLDAELGR